MIPLAAISNSKNIHRRLVNWQLTSPKIQVMGKNTPPLFGLQGATATRSEMCGRPMSGATINQLLVSGKQVW